MGLSENAMDGGAWWATVHGVTRSQTRLSDFTFTFHFHALEKEMATHARCSCLENPRDGGAWWAARLWGRTESDTTEATQQQQQVALVVMNLPADAGDIRASVPSLVGEIPWRRAWQPTPVFSPGESP